MSPLHLHAAVDASGLKTDACLKVDLSLSSWSLHTEFLNSHVSNLTAEKFPGLVASQFGLDCIEFYEGDYAADFMSQRVNLEHAQKIKAACDASTVRVVCVAASNDLVDCEGREGLEREFERLVKWAEHCAVLDCPVLRINTGRLALNEERAKLLAARLKELLGRLKNKSLVLAIENHPLLLETEEDIQRIIDVIEMVDDPRMRACPDVGAISPGLWPLALEKLAPYAAHIHLKPHVTDRNENGETKPISVMMYGPVLKNILLRHGFKGTLSFEFTAYQDLNANPRRETLTALQNIARAFGLDSRCLPREMHSEAADGERIKINNDEDLAPPKSILRLLADGCEANLEAEIKIHDFATKENIYSLNSAHAQGNGSGLSYSSPRKANSFCALVQSNPGAKGLCEKFHNDKLDRIRNGVQSKPQMCICPMGLMVLSVPVRDEKHLYGALSCGAWIEQGTEGMVFDSIAVHAPANDRPTFKHSVRDISAYSIDKLQKSQQTLEGLAEQLSRLYARRLEERDRLVTGTKIIKKVRQAADRGNLDEFMQGLGPLFKEFQNMIGFGSMAFYRPNKQEVDGAIEYIREVSVEATKLPEKFSLPPHSITMPDEPKEERVSKFLSNRITGFRISFTTHADTAPIIVFAADQTPTKHINNLVDQFAGEVAHTFISLLSLEEVKAAKRALEQFMDRTKHTLKHPLQEMANDIKKLWDAVSRSGDNRAAIQTLVTNLKVNLEDAKQVIGRFSIGARPMELGARLRSRYKFSKSRLLHILHHSMKRQEGFAKKRNVEIKIISMTGIGSDQSIECDKVAIQEIFDDLIHNAVKFANDGTDVRITGRYCTPGDPVDWSLAGKGVRFTVSDKGLGIPPGEEEKIFSPYIQSSAEDPDRVIPGTGLGLAICKEHVEAHGGKIRAFSQLPTQNQILTGRARWKNCIVMFEVDLPDVRRDTDSPPT